MSEGHDVAVIGAGQAELSLSYELSRAGVDHVILEGDDRPLVAWAVGFLLSG